MLIELILALVIGVIIGTITGLLPGLHINLVSAILLAISATLLAFTSPIVLVVFVIALSITHTFIDFIPTIFLGAPNEDTILSTLPGHKMLLSGNAYSAVIYSIKGALTGIVISLFLIPLFIIFLPIIYPYFQRIMWIILILSSAFLIITEKEKKISALLIFLLSGFLGIAVLNSNLNLNEPLLPMLTGLFGASGLIISINQKTKIPKQEIPKFSDIKLNKPSLLKSIFSSIIASPIPAFLPGMGSSQAALIGSQLNEKINEKEFLFLIGAINIIVIGLSFITLYSINKTRTGAAAAIYKLIPNLSTMDLAIIITTITISGIFAFLISIKLAKFFSKNINKINYSKLSIAIIVLLAAFTIYFSGFLGFLVFIISTALGISAILLGVKRIQLMGCLLVPTILYYLI